MILAWWTGRPPGPLLVLDVTVGALSWLLTLLLLWRPVATTAVLTVLAALSPAASPAGTMGALQVARRRPAPAAIAMAAAGLAAHAVQGAWRATGGLPYGWWLVLITIGYGGGARRGGGGRGPPGAGRPPPAGGPPPPARAGGRGGPGGPRGRPPGR